MKYLFKSEGQHRVLEIIQDEYPTCPRDADNLGTMACFHSRYNLGDEKESDSIGSVLYHLLVELCPEMEGREWVEDELWNENEDVMHKAMDLIQKKAVILPLYLYDHSGLTMNTTGFTSRWDSGQVGIIYVTYEDLRKEYDWKNVTKKRRAQAEKWLKNEVETYDQFLTGDVWGFQVQNLEGDVLDTCGGFFGNDIVENGMCGHIGVEFDELLEVCRDSDMEYREYVIETGHMVVYLDTLVGPESETPTLVLHTVTPCKEHPVIWVGTDFSDCKHLLDNWDNNVEGFYLSVWIAGKQVDSVQWGKHAKLDKANTLLAKHK